MKSVNSILVAHLVSIGIGLWASVAMLMRRGHQQQYLPQCLFENLFLFHGVSLLIWIGFLIVMKLSADRTEQAGPIGETIMKSVLVRNIPTLCKQIVLSLLNVSLSFYMFIELSTSTDTGIDLYGLMTFVGFQTLLFLFRSALRQRTLDRKINVIIVGVFSTIFIVLTWEYGLRVLMLYSCLFVLILVQYVMQNSHSELITSSDTMSQRGSFETTVTNIFIREKFWIIVLGVLAPHYCLKGLKFALSNIDLLLVAIPVLFTYELTKFKLENLVTSDMELGRIDLERNFTIGFMWTLLLILGVIGAIVPVTLSSTWLVLYSLLVLSPVFIHTVSMQFHPKNLLLILISILLACVLIMTTYKSSIPSPSTNGSESLYSKHFCIGDNNDVEQFRNRVCIFTNICYAPFQKKKRWIYFQKPGSTLITAVNPQTGELIRDSFPQPFAILKRSDDESKVESPWTPTVISNEIPLREPFNRLTARFDSSKLAILYEPYWMENFGHVLNDDLFATYAAMQLFNTTIQPEHVRLLLNSDCSMFLDGDEHSRCNRFFSSWSPLIANIPSVNVNKMGEIEKEQDPNQLICYEKMLVGLTSLNFHNHDHTGHAPLFWNFRNHLIRQLGLNPNQRPSKQTILIAHKPENQRRHIVNFKEMVDFVRENFPDTHVQVEQFFDKPARDQVRILQDSTVFITMPGAISQGSIFLSSGTSAIYVDILRNEKSSSLEGYLWTHLSWFKHFRYPVRKEEIVIDEEIIKEHNSNKWSRKVTDREEMHRNYGSVRIDLNRLKLLIENAINQVEF